MNTTFNWMVDYAYAKEFVKALGILATQCFDATRCQ